MISLVLEQITDEEINEYMRNLFKSLPKDRQDSTRSKEDILKDKIDEERKEEKNLPWMSKTKLNRI